MFESVVKFKTMWDRSDTSQSLSSDYRLNRFDKSIAHHEVKIESLHDVHSIFDDVQATLNGRCVTIQFFFNGDLPIPQLLELGFKRNPREKRIYNLPYNQYQVSAIHLDTNKTWLIQIMNRKDSGISKNALNLKELFESTQTVLNFELEVI